MASVDLGKISSDTLYDLKTAAELVDYSPQTLAKYLRSKELKGTKPKQRGRWIIKGKDLVEWYIT